MPRLAKPPAVLYIDESVLCAPDMDLPEWQSIDEAVQDARQWFQLDIVRIETEHQSRAGWTAASKLPDSTRIIPTRDTPTDHLRRILWDVDARKKRGQKPQQVWWSTDGVELPITRKQPREIAEMISNELDGKFRILASRLGVSVTGDDLLPVFAEHAGIKRW